MRTEVKGDVAGSPSTRESSYSRPPALSTARASVGGWPVLGASAVLPLERRAFEHGTGRSGGARARSVRRTCVARHRAVSPARVATATPATGADGIHLSGDECAHLRAARRAQRRLLLQPGCDQSAGGPGRAHVVSPPLSACAWTGDVGRLHAVPDDAYGPRVSRSVTRRLLPRPRTCA